MEWMKRVETHHKWEWVWESIVGKRASVYFQQKYAQKIFDTIEMDKHHPFLTELMASFDANLVSQQKAKETLSQAILDSILRLDDPKWPLGVFFFHGPTGVGKTEIVKALAETIFWDAGGFIKVNCENFSESHTGSNLFWSPKWYIGYDEEPVFSNKKVTLAYDTAKKIGKLHPMVSRLPWCNILLFDEIEKAHPVVIQQLLALLDEGKITTSKWEVVNFQNSIIIFTSNIWQERITHEKNKNAIWFSPTWVQSWDVNKIFQSSLKDIFKPEFIGRIHSFIEFEELSKQNCIKIIDIQVKKFNDYLLKYFAETHIQFELSPEVYDYILKNGYSQTKWARDLIRCYENFVKRYLTRLLSSNSFKKYYEYEGNVLIGIDIDDKNELFFDIILDAGNEQDASSANVILLPFLWERSEISLEKLQNIYANISAYTELSYVSIDGDVDLRDELKIYSDRLKQLWLSQTDISSLKYRGYLEWLRDLAFLKDFEWIVLDEETQNLFIPYDMRTILKIVERKMEGIHKKYGKKKKIFVKNSMEWVIEIIARLMWVEELSGGQLNEVLIYIRKVLVEKYGIYHDY